MSGEYACLCCVSEGYGFRASRSHMDQVVTWLQLDTVLLHLLIEMKNRNVLCTAASEASHLGVIVSITAILSTLYLIQMGMGLINYIPSLSLSLSRCLALTQCLFVSSKDAPTDNCPTWIHHCLLLWWHHAQVWGNWGSLSHVSIHSNKFPIPFLISDYFVVLKAAWYYLNYKCVYLLVTYLVQWLRQFNLWTQFSFTNIPQPCWWLVSDWSEGVD